MLIDATLDETSATPYSSPRSAHRYPAVAGRQGLRFATFATQIAPQYIEDVLGHDPRSRNHKLIRDHRIKMLYEHVQRKTSTNRIREMEAYLQDRIFAGQPISGALPAVSLAVEQPIAFIQSSTHNGIGEMALETGRQNRRIVLDGLGRITGLLDLLDLVTSRHGDDDKIKTLGKALRSFTLPVIFYAPQMNQEPLMVEEMEQLFADFNFRVRVVSVKDAIALDHSDQYIEATRWLSKNAQAIADYGGMEEKAASLSKKSNAIVVQTVLLRFVRAAVEGEGFVESGRNVTIENPNLTAARAPEIRADLAEFLDVLADSMGPAAWGNRHSMHLSSPGWQTIGVLYHDMAFRLRKSRDDMRKFASAIARLDWRREGEMFKPFVTERVSVNGPVVRIVNSAGATIRRELVRACREKLGLDHVLAEKEAREVTKSRKGDDWVD